jgi:diguanylate cyclase (GGDEF)-like protein/PAS domain S-box-containing protein
MIQSEKGIKSILRLLIIEDVIEDIELIVLALELAELEFIYDEADTASVVEDLLAKNCYDAVLADYRLPNLNGLEVLEILQASGKEIPLILVTGSLGEEAAVECIKAGMTDYVLKDRLFRLPAVLNRALKEFEIHRQRQEAIEQIHQQAQQQVMINRIVQAMRDSLVLDEILQATVNQLHEILQVTRCLIFQPDPQERMKIKFVSEGTLEGKVLIGIYCNFYEYYQTKLCRGEQLFFNKIDDRLHPDLQKAAEACQIRSLLITPLLYQQGYLGGISLNQCDRERQWTESELSLMKVVADQCAIAIHQAKLYQQTQLELAERKRIEKALRISEKRFRALIENANDIIVILNAEGILQYVSPSFKRILGYCPENIINSQAIKLINPQDRPRIIRYFRKVLKRPNIEQLPIEFHIHNSQGNEYILEAVVTNLVNEPAVKGVVVNCYDITQRKKTEAQLQYEAFHDKLTGLFNRVLFVDRLEQAIKRIKRTPNHLFAVLLFDVDRFKVIIDSLGHFVGDRLLIAIASRLKISLRESDTVARLGGDEFAILLEDVVDVHDAIHVTHRIQQELTAPFIVDNHEIFITVSVGITLSGSDTKSPDHVLRNVDTAMYQAKSLGRGRYKVFDSTMHEQAIKLLQLENDLRRAIQRQEFVAYYQPIISLETNQIMGFEALVRWQHTEKGLISPAEFIPVAEETGLIVAIGQWILSEACLQLLKWHQQFPMNPPLTISVNLSVKQLLQSDFIEHLDQLIKDTQLDPSCLKLEVTESVLIENTDLIKTVFMQIRERNIQICLDDFGTGYSSLSYLHRFPINILKIDRSFVSQMGLTSQLENSSIDPMEIVRSILQLSQTLEMKVVAEGVETSEQLSQLKALQCHYVQGYFFSKPVPSHLATNFLKSALL